MNNQPPYKPHPIKARNLSPFDLYQPVPTEFGENITYIEYLMGLLKTVNQCITYLDYLNGLYTGWDNQINEIKTTLQKQGEILQNQINQLTKDYKAADVQYLKFANIYTDNQIAEINQKIDNITSKLNPVYDPTTGYVLPVQVVIMNVYEAGRCDALTAEEYDALELTAEEYDNKELTSKEYDQHGKSLLN